MENPRATGESSRVRIATREEMTRSIACVVTAFATDPLARFLWPAPQDYLRAMPQCIQAYATGSLKHRCALVSEDFGGTAFWLPPGAGYDTGALETLFKATVEAGRLDDVLASFEQMEKWRPKEPHWYLTFIGVEPNAQGRGLGGALMSHGVSQCDRVGQLAYLESTNPRNISLYERHGFEVVGEIRVGRAPVLTPMLRKPR